MNSEDDVSIVKEDYFQTWTKPFWAIASLPDRKKSLVIYPNFKTNFVHLNKKKLSSINNTLSVR